MTVDLRALSTYDLLNVWSGVSHELKRRKLTRTNNVVGELTESIAHEHFGGERSHFSGSGWDLRTPTGEYIQVKGLWRTTPKRTKCSAIRGANYDTAAVIVLGPTWDLVGAFTLSRATVEQRYPVNPHVNGRQIDVTLKFMADPEVQSIDVSDAYARVISSNRPGE